MASLFALLLSFGLTYCESPTASQSAFEPGVEFEGFTSVVDIRVSSLESLRFAFDLDRPQKTNSSFFIAGANPWFLTFDENKWLGNSNVQSQFPVAQDFSERLLKDIAQKFAEQLPEAFEFNFPTHQSTIILARLDGDYEVLKRTSLQVHIESPGEWYPKHQYVDLAWTGNSFVLVHRYPFDTSGSGAGAGT